MSGTLTLTHDGARKIKADHREAMGRQAKQSALTKGLSQTDAETLAANVPDFVVAQFDKYSAHFIGEDARVVSLVLDCGVETHDGAPYLEIDRRDWNAALAQIQAAGYHVCHTDLPAEATAGKELAAAA